MTMLPPLNLKKETTKITDFIQKTLKQTGKQNVVIGLSGGVDSTTALFLLYQAIDPKSIHVVHLSYFERVSTVDETLHQLKIPTENIQMLSIKPAVDEAAETLRVMSSRAKTASNAAKTRDPYSPEPRIKSGVTDYSKIASSQTPRNDKIRLGNITARMRMIFLYDLAKKHDALVCGTENKSEHLLGYFTRFGDEASDFEVIRHLYKTQIYELAIYLHVPNEVIKQTPTAGLWHNQTDEEEFGFSYEEADQVLYLYFGLKQTLEVIKTRGFKNAEKIINWARNNHFKHEVPYLLK